jgi:hypothetical protein
VHCLAPRRDEEEIMASRSLPKMFRVEIDHATSIRPGLTPELRARVMDRITTFIEAFDVALVSPTAKGCDALYDATDQVIRATARVLIELERISKRH